MVHNLSYPEPAELTFLYPSRTDRTTRIPSCVASPLPANHAAKDSVFVKSRNTVTLKIGPLTDEPDVQAWSCVMQKCFHTSLGTASHFREVVVLKLRTTFADEPDVADAEGCVAPRRDPRFYRRAAGPYQETQRVTY